MITNDDLLIMLAEICDRVRSLHPVADDNPPVDADLLFALGQIGGLALRALVEHQTRTTGGLGNVRCNEKSAGR